MAAILGPRFAGIWITKPGSFKQSDPAAVRSSFARYNANTTLVPDPLDAWDLCRKESAKRGLPLLVIGSFYLCAEVAGAL
jgi:dihydrofolate synthase/folylpolyglutamate synthase